MDPGPPRVGKLWESVGQVLSHLVCASARVLLGTLSATSRSKRVAPEPGHEGS